MSYDQYETSPESGQPIELYDFLLAGVHYRYTSNAADVTREGDVYQAIPISRGHVLKSRDDKSGEKLEVTIPSTTTIAQNYAGSLPGRRAGLTIFRTHRNDPAHEAIVVYLGQVQTVRFTENATKTILTLLPVTAAQTRQIPRETYSSLCNHMLYSAQCGIDELSPTWRKLLTVTGVNGTVLTVPGAGACGGDFFVAGFITFSGDYRQIIAQAGDQLTILTPFTLSPLNQLVVLNAGCRHRLVADCQAKFNNVINFGGYPFVPLQNPFITGL